MTDHVTDAKTKAEIKAWVSSITQLESEDIAVAILYTVTQLPRVNVKELLLSQRTRIVTATSINPLTMVTNTTISHTHIISVEGDNATCISYMFAQHRCPSYNGDSAFDMHGEYTYTVVRTGIVKLTLGLTREAISRIILP